MARTRLPTSWIMGVVTIAACVCAWLAACAPSSGSDDDRGPVDAGPIGDVDDGGDAPRDEDVAVDVPESCDPFQPRTVSPEVFVGPTGLAGKLVGWIDEATESIELSMYELDVSAIEKALVRAQERGVAVRVVLDGKSSNDGARAALSSAGVSVRAANEAFPYFHVKTMIVDGRRAIVMSANMNGYSVKRERNYGVVLSDKDDLDDLRALFENDFAGGPEKIDLSCTRLVVSPINAREELVALVAGAKTSLDLAVMYVTDGALVDAITERKSAGVDVRVLLADPGWIDSNARTSAKLSALGIPVKYFTSLDLHAKLVMTESAAFVGSENLSTNALDNNREVGVFVTNDEPLAVIREQFEADFAGGIAP